MRLLETLEYVPNVLLLKTPFPSKESWKWWERAHFAVNPRIIELFCQPGTCLEKVRPQLLQCAGRFNGAPQCKIWLIFSSWFYNSAAIRFAIFTAKLSVPRDAFKKGFQITSFSAYWKEMTYYVTLLRDLFYASGPLSKFKSVHHRANRK